MVNECGRGMSLSLLLTTCLWRCLFVLLGYLPEIGLFSKSVIDAAHGGEVWLSSRPSPNTPFFFFFWLSSGSLVHVWGAIALKGVVLNGPFSTSYQDTRQGWKWESQDAFWLSLLIFFLSFYKWDCCICSPQSILTPVLTGPLLLGGFFFTLQRTSLFLWIFFQPLAFCLPSLQHSLKFLSGRAQGRESWTEDSRDQRGNTAGILGTDSRRRLRETSMGH